MNYTAIINYVAINNNLDIPAIQAFAEKHHLPTDSNLGREVLLYDLKLKYPLVWDSIRQDPTLANLGRLLLAAYCEDTLKALAIWRKLNVSGVSPEDKLIEYHRCVKAKTLPVFW